MTTRKFETEVNQLLHLIINSLYSHKEIFLRELVSNSSDALDKLKYLNFTDDAFKDYPFDPRVDISFDEENGTFTVSDTGIGMNEADLVEHLGTIARSGTRSFIEQMSGDNKKDSNLIGQFGVGFYSSFMVADKVEVISRKAGEEEAFKWTSDGRGEYEIEPAQRDTGGTTVILYLSEDGKEFANRWRVESIIKKYSNHIPFPIYLHFEETVFEGEGDDKTEKKEQKEEQINAASAMWKQPKRDLTDEDYREFYRTIAHDTGDPLMWVHTQAEGTLEYTTLFYVPEKAPFDMYYADYQPGVKLYVKRVFITDDERELMPTYLRFVKGVIDSEDLPLNVSREILQQNRVLAKIKSSSVKKLLEEFQNLAKNDPEKYTSFIQEYNRPMKEGLYQDFANRETLLELVRFKSTKAEKFTSLEEYKSRMQPDQNAIFYITGEKEENLRNSPLLEMYRKKDIEVLIMDDELDDIIFSQVGTYGETPLKSVNRTDSAEDLKTDEDREEEKEVEPVITRLKVLLKEEVKDVKASSRLEDSPSCIVFDQQDPTLQMQHILKAMGQGEMGDVKPVLEINPSHKIVTYMKTIEDDAMFENVGRLLLEQALLVEGVEIKNPANFVKRLNSIMEKALG
jgi:molecular chaperone HtpG